ncbi:uncharacterized protein LOC117337542 [Pecten maximus]|uniref:uncharacterized protein LOC117337542 n=1 Tax=Pecten maximus TaxID=6579 RepID=UPI001458365E|nr:uncharacterized protein LOC117337542 [Pecten maximus]XP_033754459.1 uncharacterized protein LOC117337542 [Pecten maximus]
MKSIGLWLLLLLVLVVITSEADAKKRKRKFRVRIRFTIRKNKRRGRRAIEDILTLPCDVSDYDTDKDDVISRLEWQAYITEYNPVLNYAEYVDLIIRKLDTNGDGFLQVEEFSLDTEYKKDCLEDNPGVPIKVT